MTGEGFARFCCFFVAKLGSCMHAVVLSCCSLRTVSRVASVQWNSQRPLHSGRRFLRTTPYHGKTRSWTCKQSLIDFGSFVVLGVISKVYCRKFAFCCLDGRGHIDGGVIMAPRPALVRVAFDVYLS